MIYLFQTSQLTRFDRETHGFGPLLTVSRSNANFSLSSPTSSLSAFNSHCNWFLYKFTRVNIFTSALTIEFRRLYKCPRDLVNHVIMVFESNSHA